MNIFSSFLDSLSMILCNIIVEYLYDYASNMDNFYFHFLYFKNSILKILKMSLKFRPAVTSCCIVLKINTAKLKLEARFLSYRMISLNYSTNIIEYSLFGKHFSDLGMCNFRKQSHYSYSASIILVDYK